MTPPPIASLDGVVVVDKPAGPTSHDVVAAVRRAAGTRRVGHTGTLDPFASGVLPLVVGRGTRLAQFLGGGTKTYRAEIRFGIDTDTHDRTGRPTSTAPEAALPTRDDVEVALREFVGRREQVPPAYSAKQVGGVRAHVLARRDASVPLRAVPVEVFELALEAMDAGRATARLVCGSGFYVRALARDLGRALGCGAHLTALRRLASGEFAETDAAPLDTLSTATGVAAALRPLDALLTWMPAARLSDRGAARAAHGNDVGADDVLEWRQGADSRGVRLQPDVSPGVRLQPDVSRGVRLQPDVVADHDAAPDASTAVRLLDGDGRLLGLARAGGLAGPAVLRPIVVLV